MIIISIIHFTDEADGDFFIDKAPFDNVYEP